MQMKVVWFLMSCMIVLSLVLVSCAPALEGEEEVVTPQEEEAMASEEEEVVTPQKEEPVSTLAPAPESCQLDVPCFYAGLGLEPVMGNI